MNCFGLWSASVMSGALMALACAVCSAADSGSCGASADVVLQVLGSGGPELHGGRASSGYLLWVDGRARLMVDAGGGSFLRFGETGARLQDLELLALTHFHVDHAADLPAIAKAGYFSSRENPLLVSGPAGNRWFPGTDEYLSELFGESAPFRYLGGALDGSGGQFELRPRELATAPGATQRVLERGGLTVDSIGVMHGPLPAVSYRVTVSNRSVVFAGDQDGSVEAFWAFAADADVLVAHLAIPGDAGPVARRLHATPGAIALGAAKADVKHLLLSHLMQRSLANLDESLTVVRKSYGGKISVAQDLQCISVP